MNDCSYVYLDVRDDSEFFKQQERQLNIKPSFDLEKEDGKIIYGKELTYLGKGNNATVWKYESEGKKYAVKIFFASGLSCALTKDIYWTMKNLPLKNTLKALETLKIVDSDGTVRPKRHSAYIIDFLEEEKDYSIVEMSTSKLLENSSALESDAKILAKNNVAMQDLNRENTIFNNNDGMLYLSDIDMFFMHYDEFNAIRKNNSIELSFVFYEYLKQYSFDYYNGIYNSFFKDLFFKNNTHEKSITNKLEDIFSPYDTPKQFFKDNKNYYYKKYLK